MAEPVCAVQASCGGCPLLTLDRQSELKGKLDSVSTSLSAVGIHAEILPVRAQERFGYRNRLRMKVVGGRVEFFNSAKDAGCLVVRPDLWGGIEQLLRVTASSPDLLTVVTHVEVRVGDDGNLALVTSVPVDQAPLQQALGDRWVIGYRGMEDAPTLRYLSVGDVQIDVPITSFVQVNSNVNRQMVQAVLEIADHARAETFLDLFCGAGNFAIPLAERGLTGTAVENVGSAIAQLGISAAASRGAIRCIEGDARMLLPGLAEADLVIADPPRAGLQGSHNDLEKLVHGTLVLIGCKTSSFARDVAALCGDRLKLKSVQLFDMFPGTNHVEALAVFESHLKI